MDTRRLTGITIALLLCITAAGAQTYDDFDGSTLKPFWTLVREQPDHWSLSEGFLEITTQQGALNTTEYNNVRNTFLQEVPDEDIIRMETFLLFTPDYWYHNAGLIYRVDDDNYIRVSRGIYPDVNGVWMEWEVDGVTQFHFIEPYLEDHVYLRLSRTNDSVFAATYSADGASWYAIGTESIHFPDGTPMAGLQAANGEGLAAQGEEILARFDYFGMKPTAVKAPWAVPSALTLLSVYPSPLYAGSSAVLRLRLDRPSELQWQLTDMLGRRVLAPRSLGHLQSGTHNVSLSLRDVPPGIYFMHVMAAHSRATQRILLTR